MSLANDKMVIKYITSTGDFFKQNKRKCLQPATFLPIILSRFILLIKSGAEGHGENINMS